MKSKFRELWLKGEKWIEARLKQDVGMLQEAQIIDIQGLGWARVYNVWLIDLGHLILFNLQFLSHNLVHVNA